MIINTRTLHSVQRLGQQVRLGAVREGQSAVDCLAQLLTQVQYPSEPDPRRTKITEVKGLLRSSPEIVVPWRSSLSTRSLPGINMVEFGPLSQSSGLLVQLMTTRQAIEHSGVVASELKPLSRVSP